MFSAQTESPIYTKQVGCGDRPKEAYEQIIVEEDDKSAKSLQKKCTNSILPMLDYSCRRCKSCKKVKPPASFFIQKESGKIVIGRLCSFCRKDSRQRVNSAKSAFSDCCGKKFRQIKGKNTPFSVLLPADHADISDSVISELSKIKPSQIGIIGDSVKIADVNSLFNIYSLGYTNLSMMYNIDQYLLYLSLLNQMIQLSYIPPFPTMSQTVINQNQQQQQIQQQQQQTIASKTTVKEDKSPASPSSTIIGVINSNVDFTISFDELKNIIPTEIFNGLKKEHQTQLTIYSNNPQTVFKLLPNSLIRKKTLINELIKFYELLTLTITCNACKETVQKMYCFIHKDNFICRECSLKVESHELLDWNCDNHNNNNNTSTASTSNNIINNNNYSKCFTIQCVRCKHSICYHKYLKYNRNGEIKRQNTCSYCRLKQWRDYYLGISNNGNGSILSNE